MSSLEKVALVFSLIIFCTGCTTVAGTGNPPSSLTDVYYGTQTTIGKCPSDLGESGIAAAIGAAAIAKGVSRIGAAIKASAKEKTSVSLARRNIEITQKGLGPCVIVARGWFFRDRAILAKSDYRPGLRNDFKYDSQPSRIQQQGVWIAATPDFFFEGKLIPASDGSALSMTPVYAYFGKPIESNLLRPGGSRSILVAMAITKPAKAADLSKGQGSTVILGRFEEQSSKEFSGKKAELFTCDQETCDIKKSSQYNQIVRGPYESEWFSVPLTTTSQPMTLQALVSETQSESKFLTFVGDVFSDVQSDLTTQLQQSLIPSKANAADNSEKATEEDALSAYEAQYATALKALADCASNGTDTSKAALAKSAMRSTNQKARKADKIEPFGSSNIDNIVIAPNKDASAACNAILQ